jgi:flagellar protein FliO/FliZ
MDFADVMRGMAALALTLGLIGVAAVLARRYGPNALLRVQPKTTRRLAIVESLMLDPARRLVVVRFDDEERLLLLGEGRVLAEGKARPAPSAEMNRES